MVAMIVILFGMPALLLSIDFVKYLLTGTRYYNNLLTRILEVVAMLILPILYLWLLDEKNNDCCSDSATFAPDHKLTIYAFTAIGIITYFYSCYKKSMSTPVIEVAINSVLLFALLFNIAVAIQVGAIFLLFGNLPIAILLIFRLIENHKQFIEFNKSTSSQRTNFFEKVAWKILTLNPFIKLPLLFVLCLPILVITVSLLQLFGQKPDSIILAFTETYKHGFSQLDYLCENVDCGGHFLCSVAANGHKTVVKPVRYGERNGHKIICNRQLLIANAFEELIEQKLPKTHQVIRRNYNKVGNLIHRHYHIFNNKFISDFLYILMKPLELLFIITLYTFDKKPENRIAKQYQKPIK